MNFKVIDHSQESIAESFDQLAKVLLENYSLLVNDKVLEFTEIEFYYHKIGVHADESVHKHNRNAGEWRAHRAGLDITFDATDTSDGGILIRGIKCGDEYINGPLRVMTYIFQSFGSVIQQGNIQLIKKENFPTTSQIFKTTRHGLGKSVSPDFKEKPYRYFVEMDKWNSKHLSKAKREELKIISTKLK